MISGRWFITPHAVRRYIERVHHHVSYDQALSELIRASETAHYVKPHTGGSELWRTGKPQRLRLVVMPSTDGLPALVTVLPAHDWPTRNCEACG